MSAIYRTTKIESSRRVAGRSAADRSELDSIIASIDIEP